jgi:flagellar hook-length control protein FliK
MDVRLLMDGGVHIGAPPGNKVESPPPNRKEFSQELEKAKGESKTGEVVESEPNAPLQKLDSSKEEQDLLRDGSMASLMPLDFILSASISTLPTDVASVREGGVIEDAQIAPLTAGGHFGVLLEGQVLSDGLTDLDQAAVKSEFDALAENLNATDIQFLETKVPNQAVVGAEIQSASSAPTEVTASNIVSPKATTLETTTETDSNESIAGNGQSIGTPSTGNASTGSQESATDSEAEDSSEHAQGHPLISSETVASSLNVDAKTLDEVKDSVGLSPQERAKVVAKIADKIEQLNANSVRQEVRVRMEPAELGSVVVRLKRDLEGITASLQASNEGLRDNLSESRKDLVAALNAKGLQQVKIEVSSTDSTSTQHDASRHREGSHPQSNQEHRRSSHAEQRSSHHAIHHNHAQPHTRSLRAVVKVGNRQSLNLEI